MFGHSEELVERNYVKTGDVDYICFTDDPELRSNTWTLRLVRRTLLDPARRSKTFKHLPHRYLGEYDESLYVDNRVRIIAPVDQIFSHLSRSEDLYCYRHPWRNCVYQEALRAIEREYDDRETIECQMNEYRRLGYPPENGLIAATLLLRRHSSAPLVDLMEEWSAQTIRHSKRDQLSFDVCAWLHRYPAAYFADTITRNALFEWPTPDPMLRIPRNFKDHEYLAANPSVAASGINPRQHYLASIRNRK